MHRLSTDRKTERKRVFSIPQAVNLDTSQIDNSRNKEDDFSLELYSYCYDIHQVELFQESLSTIIKKGVQALQLEIGTDGWLHFLRYSQTLRAEDKTEKRNGRVKHQRKRRNRRHRY